LSFNFELFEQCGLSLLSAVAVIALVNVLIGLVLPNIKQLFPDNDFGKGLFTFSLVLLIFGLALFAFLFVASRLHQRPIMSVISNRRIFSWKQYFIGFMAWGSLLFIGSAIFDYQKLERFIANFNLYLSVYYFISLRFCSHWSSVFF
jgi:hypothetical protein